MKILVPIKRVADPDNVNKIKVVDNGKKVSSEGLEWKINPFDEYALEAALRLNEDGLSKKVLGDTIVVSIGPEEVTQQLRQCLAMGASKAILVNGRDEDLDAYIVAEVLVKIYEREKPDLIIMGKQAVDGDSNLVGQILAEKLRLPQATFVSGIEVPKEGGWAFVSRETDGGSTFEKVYFPAVITVDLRIVAPTAVKNNITPLDKVTYQEGPRFASAKGIIMAKKKPLEQISLSDLGVSTQIKIEYVKFETPPPRKAGIKVSSIPELVEKLHKEAKVI